jgi:6-methylsalicylate decarboxylase
LDTLKADGISLWTSYADKWPGDPSFAPVFEELNQRHAVAFFHHAPPACCRTLQPGVMDRRRSYFPG